MYWTDVVGQFKPSHVELQTTVMHWTDTAGRFRPSCVDLVLVVDNNLDLIPKPAFSAQVF